MDLKFRKVIAKVKPLRLLARVVMYNSGYFFYRKMYNNNNYRGLFAELHNSRVGKRCFIIGNGPSLRAEDLTLLINEDCFAANEIYRIFDKTDWRPKYYLIMDRYSKTVPEQLERLDIENIFLGDYYWRFNSVKRKDAICLHQHNSFNERRLKFSDDISKCVYNSATVSYGLMQIAAYLGYSEIYLLGFDHNYPLEFDSKGRVIKTKQKSAHFFNDDIPKNIIANVNAMNKAYEVFLGYAIKQNIIVKNATHGGKLEVFGRVNFYSLLNTF